MNSLGILFLLCAFFLSPQSLSVAYGEEPVSGWPLEANPAWHACENAGDCTVVRGFCNNPEAVNRQYGAQYEAWVKNSGPAACTLMPPPQSICITCEQSRCSAKVKRHSKSK